MKHLLTFLAVAVSVALLAQPAYIKTKAGREINAKIKAISGASVYTDRGTFNPSELDSVAIKDKPELNETLTKLLTAFKVKVAFVDDLKAVVGQPVPTLDNQALSRMVEAYRAEQEVGYGFQLVGVLLLGGSVAMQAIYDRRFEQDLAAFAQRPTTKAPEPKYVPAALPVAGLGLMSIGVVINLSANGKLRVKTR